MIVLSSLRSVPCVRGGRLRRTARRGQHGGVVLGALAGALMALAPGCSSPEQSAAGTGGAAPTGGVASVTGGASTTGGTTSTTGGVAPTGGASTTGGAASAGAAGAAAGSGGGSGGGMRPATVPIGDTQADLETFLKAGSYKSAPWAPDSTAPRDSTGSSPHGRVRVWMNPPLADSLRAGRTGLPPNPPVDQWAMAVKEFYDDADALVGITASFKVVSGTMADNWIYYCYGPAGDGRGRCKTASEAVPQEMAIFGRGSIASCSCHGGFVISQPPPLP